jgi:hypothetical protein
MIAYELEKIIWQQLNKNEPLISYSEQEKKKKRSPKIQRYFTMDIVHHQKSLLRKIKPFMGKKLFLKNKFNK